MNSDVEATNLTAHFSWQNENSRSLIILATILGISLLLRGWYTNGQSITFDENYEIQLAQEPIAHILAKGDGFPPLYAVLLRVWQLVFGTDSARAFSIALGAICCVAVYQLGRLVDGEKTGIWSAAILAVLPIHLFYSTEARAYSLLFVIATLALSCTILAIETKQKRHWFAFAILATMGLHTHYLFALFVAITMTVAFFQMGDKRWYPVSAAVAIWAMIAPMVLLWAPADFQMQNEWAYRVDFGLGELAYTYGSFIMGYTLGPSLRALHGMSLSVAIQQVLPWALLIGTAMFLVISSVPRRLPERRRAVPLLLAVAVAPIGMGILCNIADVGYQVRYSIWAVVPCIVLFGSLVSQAIDKSTGRIGIGVLAISFAISIFNRHYIDDYRNEDLASVSKFIKQQPIAETRNAPILVVSGYMAEPLKIYFETDQEIVGIPMTAGFDERASQMKTILDNLAANHSSFSLIYTRDFHEDPDGILMQQLQDRTRITRVSEFAGIVLYRAEFQ